jgi:DNA polymerase III subunit beta
MKSFSVNSKEFSKMLNKLIAVVPKKATLPIISYALFEVDSENAILKGRATNLEVQLDTQCAIALPDADFKFLIEPAEINTMLKKFPEQPVTISYDENKVILSVDKKKYEFPTIPDFADFPQTLDKDVKDVKTFEVETEAFFDVFDKAMNTVGNDDLRPVMNGVCVKDHKGQTCVLSTDAHFLSLYNIDVEMPNTAFIIPKIVKPMLKIIALEENCNINVSDKYVSIEGKDKLIFRTIEGIYPDAHSIIPDTANAVHIITIETEVLRAAIDRLSLVAENNYVKFYFAPKGEVLSLEAKNIDKSKFGEEFIEEVTIESKVDDDCTFGLSPTKLLQLMQSFTFSEVNLFFFDNGKAIIFKPANVNSDDSTFLLMPMMIS